MRSSTASVTSFEEQFVFAGKTTTQNMLRIGDQVSEIAVLGDDYRDVEAEYDKTLELINDGVEVLRWTDIDRFLGTMLGVMDGFVLVWIVVIFLALSFGLVNTLVMAVFERIREIGLMLALGMTPGMILGQIVAEALALIEDQILPVLRTKKYVVVKPNLVSTLQPLAVTHADAINGILDFLAPRWKGPVVIAESSAGNTLSAYENFEYEQALSLLAALAAKPELAAPVRDANGTTVGVIQILNKREGAFSGDDAAQLTALMQRNPTLRVNLRADRDTHYTWIQPVLRAVSRAAAAVPEERAPLLPPPSFWILPAPSPVWTTPKNSRRNAAKRWRWTSAAARRPGPWAGLPSPRSTASIFFRPVCWQCTGRSRRWGESLPSCLSMVTDCLAGPIAPNQSWVATHGSLRSPPPPYWPRFSATARWSPWKRSTPATVWRGTRATRPGNTWRRCSGSESPPCIARALDPSGIC